MPSCANESAEQAQEREAFLRLCEALGIAATSHAYLEGARLNHTLAQTQARLAFVLKHGLPMARHGLYRYHGVNEPHWHASQEAAIDAALQESLQ